MYKLLPVLLLLVGCVMPAAAASFEEFSPYLSGRYFTWEEHVNGQQILKESGPIISAGALLGFATPSYWTIRGKAEIFGGQVGYNGETLASQSQPSEPVQTEVNYLGIKQELDLGYRVLTGKLRVEPFAGLGYRWWLRMLQDSATASGQAISGYTEQWLTGYCRLGARGRYLDSSGVSFFAEGGAKYPFYTGNSIDFANSGTTTFRPGGEWSGFAETGIGWRQLKLTL